MSIPLRKEYFKQEVRPVVLITGASTGLGLAIAKQLHQSRRYHLILTARASSLDRFSGATLHTQRYLDVEELDVTSQQDQARVIAKVLEQHGSIFALINNAGISLRAVMEEMNERELMTQMQVNFLGPVALTRLCLPSMRQNRCGRIINISSVGGMMAMPTMGAYSASKFALEGASEALYYEVRPFNIWVTLLQPGFINSDGFEHVAYTKRSGDALRTHGSAYHQHYYYMADFISKMMRRVPATPESVARKVELILAKKRPPLRCAGTFDAIVFSFMRRLLPRTLYHALLYRLLPGISAWGKEDEQD